MLKRTSCGYMRRYLKMPASPGPTPMRRQVPPYWPISSSGSITIGLAGSRSSTGGMSPLATISASIGASLYCDAGIAASPLSDAAGASAAGASAAGSSPPPPQAASTAPAVAKADTCRNLRREISLRVMDSPPLGWVWYRTSSLLQNTFGFRQGPPQARTGQPKTLRIIQCRHHGTVADRGHRLSVNHWNSRPEDAQKEPALGCRLRSAAS